MKTSSRLAGGVFVALALLSLPAAAAARCVEPAPIAQAVQTADVVLVGTVTAIEQGGRLATVTVTEVWRGPDQPAIVKVRGGPADGPTSVDRTFEVGARYLFTLILAANGGLGDNACSSTTTWEPGHAAIRPADIRTPLGAVAGPGETAGSGEAAVAEAPFDPWSVVAPVGAALLAALVLLGVGLLARGRQPR